MILWIFYQAESHGRYIYIYTTFRRWMEPNVGEMYTAKSLPTERTRSTAYKMRRRSQAYFTTAAVGSRWMAAVSSRNMTLLGFVQQQLIHSRTAGNAFVYVHSPKASPARTRSLLGVHFISGEQIPGFLCPGRSVFVAELLFDWNDSMSTAWTSFRFRIQSLSLASAGVDKDVVKLNDLSVKALIALDKTRLSIEIHTSSLNVNPKTWLQFEKPNKACPTHARLQVNTQHSALLFDPSEASIKQPRTAMPSRRNKRSKQSTTLPSRNNANSCTTISASKNNTNENKEQQRCKQQNQTNKNNN